MRKYIRNITLCFCLLLSVKVMAQGTTVITAPLDSRPISTLYLENLADVKGDKVFYPDEKYLGFWSDNAKEFNKRGDKVAVQIGRAHV